MDGATVADPQKSGKPDKPLDRVLAVLAMDGLTDREKLVVIAVATFDGAGGAFPTFDTLAATMTLKRWNVTRAVRRLEEKGVLTRKRLRYGNLYTIDYHYAFSDGGQGVPSGDDSRRRANRPPDGGQTVPQMAGNARHKQEEQEGTGIGRSPPQGERTPYPLESTRENAAPPDRLPLKGQSDGAASEKLGETETATDEDVRQAVDFTPTMRPPERPSELDEMLAHQTNAKNHAYNLELPEDEREAWEKMLPGIARDIDRLKDERTSR